MTDCPNGELRDLLPDLLHDRLAPDARRRVEEHLRTCGACQAELTLLRDLHASMRRAPAVDASRIAATIPPYRAPARRAWAGWRAAAAIVILAAGGTSVALVRRDVGVGPADSARVDVRPEVIAPAESSTRVATAPAAPVTSLTPAAASDHAHRELAMASSATSDLSERELSALLKEIESLDAVPSAEVDNTAPVSPVSPKRGES
jgi:anti-sigma factor RsiW